MLDIILQNSADSEVSVPLNGVSVSFTYSYNSRDKNWRVGLNSSGDFVFLPETLKSDTFLFQTQDEEILGGLLYCHPLTDNPIITRDNLFTDFAIRFYTTAELEG